MIFILLYSIQVHATDGHLYNSSTTNTTVQVTINVENVNDNTPKFDKGKNKQFTNIIYYLFKVIESFEALA